MPEDRTIDRPNLGALSLSLRQSCVELMSDYGVNVTPQKLGGELVELNAWPSAAVDFNGQVRGSLTLCSTRDVLLTTACAATGKRHAPRNVDDWNSELVNQLLGRLKNKLRARDVSVDVGLPRRLAESGFEPREHDLRLRFECSPGSILLFLTAAFEPGLTLGEHVVDEGLPSEGELLLF